MMGQPAPPNENGKSNFAQGAERLEAYAEGVNLYQPTVLITVPLYHPSPVQSVDDRFHLLAS